MTSPKLTEAQREALHHLIVGEDDYRIVQREASGLERLGLCTIREWNNWVRVSITDAGRAALKGES